MGSHVRVGSGAVRNVKGAVVQMFDVAGPTDAGAVSGSIVLVLLGRAAGASRDPGLGKFARFSVFPFRVVPEGDGAGEQGAGGVT